MLRPATLDLLLLILSCAFLAAKCESFVIQPKSWEYKSADIGYEVARRVVKGQGVNNDTVSTSLLAGDGIVGTLQDDTQDPILLLNGFGVGSFHQHRLIPRLLDNAVDIDGNSARTVYCMDYLGQGRSWPKDCQDGQSKNELGLQYSAETWIDQIIAFIEEVVLSREEGIHRQVHLVGNSVGGHLAAYVAVRRPDLIRSICLLNPTPVWGLNLPGWSGHLPAPIIPKTIGRFLFNRIRDLKTIERFLEQTYSRREAFSDELMHQIRGCTTGNGGHAAFASILWSPPLKVTSDPNDGARKGDFQECLSRVQCDVLLVFGRDDPWCKPAFAKKMLGALDQREPSKVHRYVEITNAGHCPNHEAPQAVGHVVNSWVAAADRSKKGLSLPGSSSLAESSLVFREDWGETTLMECGAEDIKLGLMDRLATLIV